MPIPVSCQACGTTFPAPDERRGKQVLCIGCGEPISVPEDSDSAVISSSAGAPISAEAAISEHIAQHVGATDTVLHAMFSDSDRVDIHWIKASKQRPWHTLITSGMSQHAMAVPPELALYSRAELCLHLPPDWPLSREDLNHERHYWPISLMKQLAAMPAEQQSWLGAGQIVPNGEPLQPYADNTQLSAVLLLPPVPPDKPLHQLNLGPDQTIWFYQLFPLYAEESALVEDQGLNPLIDRFNDHRVSPIVDCRRHNTCRRRRFLFF